MSPSRLIKKIAGVWIVYAVAWRKADGKTHCFANVYNRGVLPKPVIVTFKADGKAIVKHGTARPMTMTTFSAVFDFRADKVTAELRGPVGLIKIDEFSAFIY